MEILYVDRILTCSDCLGEFIFTAGEQLFFSDKQFKNDPKRCKPCKGRRSGLSAVANGAGATQSTLRTETRTECSDCGVQTTVPFKPTQGRPVLCRQCFQSKGRTLKLPQVAVSVALTNTSEAKTISALTEISTNRNGEMLSVDAAILAAASMAAATPGSSVASAADLASITYRQSEPSQFSAHKHMSSKLLAAATQESLSADLLPCASEASEA